MKIIGKITDILPVEEGVGRVSGQKWARQTFRVEQTDNSHPDSLAISILNDNINKFPIKVGDYVQVLFDGHCKVSDDKAHLYNDLTAWEIKPATQNE